MSLEAEVPMLFLAAFSIVMVGAVLTLLLMYSETHRRALFWFFGQIACLVIAFALFYRSITLGGVAPGMESETASWTLGWAGIFWAMSMVFMFRGLWSVLHNNPSD